MGYEACVLGVFETVEGRPFHQAAMKTSPAQFPQNCPVKDRAYGFAAVDVCLG